MICCLHLAPSGRSSLMTLSSSAVASSPRERFLRARDSAALRLHRLTQSSRQLRATALSPTLPRRTSRHPSPDRRRLPAVLFPFLACYSRHTSSSRDAARPYVQAPGSSALPSREPPGPKDESVLPPLTFTSRERSPRSSLSWAAFPPRGGVTEAQDCPSASVPRSCLFLGQGFGAPLTPVNS